MPLDAIDQLLREIGTPAQLGEVLDTRRAGGYRGYAEIVAAWAELREFGARPVQLGRSVAGQPLYGLEVGPATIPRLSVMIAGIHAMEWIGVEVGMAIGAALAANPPTDRRVLIVPVLNIDGYRDVESDLRAGKRRFRRANRNGVDLNRNWPTHHRPFHLPGRLFPWLGRAGERARSEPEVDGICRHLEHQEAAGTTTSRALSLHSIGRKLLFPYGGRWRPPHLASAHRAAARRIIGHFTERYRAVQCSHWVPGSFARGMEIDHLHGRFGAMSLLIECSFGGIRLTDPSSWFSPFRWFNPHDVERQVAQLAPPLERFVRG